MKSVPEPVHYAAHRFGLVSRAGGRLIKREPVRMSGRTCDGDCQVRVKEFATPGGEVIARKVSALDQMECWLRADLADAAEAALEAEAADYRQVVGELRDFIETADEQGARRNGVSVEEYRRGRHAAGTRWDNYRARQRAGGF